MSRKLGYPPLHHTPCAWEYEHDVQTEDTYYPEVGMPWFKALVKSLGILLVLGLTFAAGFAFFTLIQAAFGCQ